MPVAPTDISRHQSSPPRPSGLGSSFPTGAVKGSKVTTPRGMILCVPMNDPYNVVAGVATPGIPYDLVSGLRGTKGGGLTLTSPVKDRFGGGAVCLNVASANDDLNFNWAVKSPFKDTDPFSVVSVFTPNSVSAGTVGLWRGIFTGTTSGVGLRIGGSPVFHVGSASATAGGSLTLGIVTVAVCTSDGSAMKLYLNGAVNGTGTVAGTSGASQTPMRIFGDFQGDTGNSAGAVMHAFYVYNRPLTQNEVTRFTADPFWPLRPSGLPDIFKAVSGVATFLDDQSIFLYPVPRVMVA